MKKTIEIRATETVFILMFEANEVVSIPKNNLTIDGRTLFDNFISKLDLSTKVEFDFIDDISIDEPNEKRIVEDIKSIFNGIAQKINEKFNLNSDDGDVFQEDESEEITEPGETSDEDDLPF